MRKLKDLIISIFISGKGSQNFLGARWIPFLLKITPGPLKRKTALWILSLSPHYFYKLYYVNKKLSSNEFFEREYERNLISRKAIIDQIVYPYLKKDFIILDYGCGPGFLAKAASNYVKKIYACDISDGVIACARIINYCKNAEYISLLKNKLNKIDDGSLDLIYSFAVIQHVTDTIFEQILQECFKKLKSGGQVLMHIVVDEETWKTESEWVSDHSLTGKLKYKFALNCFSRNTTTVEKQILTAGFTKPEKILIKSIANLDDDVALQHLFIFSKREINPFFAEKAIVKLSETTAT